MDDNSNIEMFSHGIERHWYDNRHIALIKSQGDMSEAGVDAWITILQNTNDNWDIARPIAIVIDLTHPSQGITPYSRQRTRDLMSSIAENTLIYVAVLLPHTFIHQLFRVFLRNPMFQRPHLRATIHDNLDEALVWLRQMICNNAEN